MFNVVQCPKSKHYPISKLSQFQFSIPTEIGILKYYPSKGFFRYGALYVYTVGRKLSTRFRISHLRRHHLEELFWQLAPFEKKKLDGIFSSLLSGHYWRIPALEKISGFLPLFCQMQTKMDTRFFHKNWSSVLQTKIPVGTTLQGKI